MKHAKILGCALLALALVIFYAMATGGLQP